MFCDLALPGVQALTPYQPGKPVEELERELGISNIIKLASNENPLGPSEKVTRAIADILPELARYPDGNGFELKAMLSQRHDVDPACITLGNGSNDVLDLIARVFLGPGREAVFSQYAFAVYPIATRAAGAEARVVPAHTGAKGPSYGHDLDGFREAIGPQTRVVFIANPNNPTGTWVDQDTLLGFLEAVPQNVIVVLDEAYIEYVDDPDYPDGSRWLQRFPNLVVTRTFSKAWGLAALRVGYSLSHPEVADLLNRVRHPFNVNQIALSAAVAALDDIQHMRTAVYLSRQETERLTGGCKGLGCQVIPSAGNFVCINVGRDAGPVFQALLREGVIVRPLDNYGLPRHLRITAGLPDENTRFLLALRKVLQGDE